MITTVTLNPAIDRTIIVDHFVVDKVHRINESFDDVGGKGINVSKVINILGGNTLATGFLGGDNGIKIRHFLERESISEDFVDTKLNTRVNTKIIDLINNTTTDLNEKGLPVDSNHFYELKEKINKYGPQSDFIVFSGSAPKDFDMNLYEEIIRVACEHTKTVVDADGEMLKKAVKASPFMIKPNVHELVHTFGLSDNSKEGIIEFSKGLVREYNIELILISMGSEGSILVSKNEVYEAHPIKVQVHSTVGAGDSMVGGFLYRYIKDKDIVEALRYGSASGTAAVTTKGTKVFTKEQLEEVLNKINITQY